MLVLGIETSCDECAAAIVHNGTILSNVVATQIPFHSPWQGVVPEIASRMHTEWIYGIVDEAFRQAGLNATEIEGIATTAHPGLLGSLLVGLHFAKAFAWARGLPFIAVDHLLAHLYASRLVYPEPANEGRLSEKSTSQSKTDFPAYPFLGLLVSGGHSVICRADNFDDITVMGTTIDDAVGEAFDKVAKHYSFGYPGGMVIDKMAQKGNSDAFKFPMPRLYKLDKEGNDHRYDFSYSGLKTAVVNQLEQFRVKTKSGASSTTGQNPAEQDTEIFDIAASFQKTAIDILLRSLFRAIEDTGIKTVVAGGGVAANSYLRTRLVEFSSETAKTGSKINIFFPPMELCGDNAAMVAGLGEQYLLRGDRSPLETSASARIRTFKKRYP